MLFTFSIYIRDCELPLLHLPDHPPHGPRSVAAEWEGRCGSTLDIVEGDCSPVLAYGASVGQRTKRPRNDGGAANFYSKYLFSPASILTGSRFSMGEMGQVAKGVYAQGQFSARLKSRIISSPSGYGCIEFTPAAVGRIFLGFIVEINTILLLSSLFWRRLLIYSLKGSVFMLSPLNQKNYLPNISIIRSGLSVMMPSTPQSMYFFISSGSSTVHGSMWMFFACASRMKRSVIIGIP